MSLRISGDAHIGEGVIRRVERLEQVERRLLRAIWVLAVSSWHEDVLDSCLI